MIANAIGHAEQCSMVLAVDAVDIFRIEPLVTHVQIYSPMRAPIEVRKEASLVSNGERLHHLAAVLEIEHARLSDGELTRTDDAQPSWAQASVVRDGPGVGCGFSCSPEAAMSSFISSRHSGLPLR